MKQIALDSASTGRIKKYLAYRYAAGQYDPEQYHSVEGYGQITAESINYLIGKRAISPELKKLTNKQFDEHFRLARLGMIKRFGTVANEDVLHYLRTGRIVQTTPYTTSAQVTEYILNFEQEHGAMTQEEVDQVWSVITDKFAAKAPKISVYIEPEINNAEMVENSI